MKTIKRREKKRRNTTRQQKEMGGRKRNEGKKKKKEIDRSPSRSVVFLTAVSFSLSLSVSPLLPSHSTPFGENNDKAFPSISDYFDFAQVPPCLAKKGRSFRVDRDLFRSLHRERFAYHESLFSFVPFLFCSTYPGLSTYPRIPISRQTLFQPAFSIFLLDPCLRSSARRAKAREGFQVVKT